MKKGLALFLLCSDILFVPALAIAEAPEPSAASAILIHAESGSVLLEKNADEPRLIASTTKLMTALVAAENSDLSAEVEIRQEWTGVEGSSFYLKSGERYTLRELLEGLLLSSGNDAALAVSGAVAGSTEKFVSQMNSRARELGLANTHFSNPHGLNAEDHFSSARDLAEIMAAVWKIPSLREILGESSALVHGRVIENHNKLLGSCPGVDGGKTGYTKAAGRCLVSTCERDGLRLICVTLSDPEDWADHAALYDWAYSRYEAWHFPGESPVPEIPLLAEPGAFVRPVSERITLCLEAGDCPAIVWKLPPFLIAAQTGDFAGEALVCLQGKTLCRVSLTWERREACVCKNISPSAVSAPAGRPRSGSEPAGSP